MNKTIISVSLIAFFTLGTLIAVLGINSMKDDSVSAPNYSPEAHADWPVYDFNKIMSEKADLVAFVTVEKIEDKKASEGGIDSKLSTLKIKEVLYDKRTSVDISNTVVLNQAIEYVKVGESYLLFLQKNGDYYYEVDGNSKIQEVDGKYQVKIKGIKGQYTTDTFKNQFTLALNEINLN